MMKTDVQFGKIILEHAACNIFFHLPSEQYILYEWALPMRYLVSLFEYEYRINVRFPFFVLYVQVDVLQ